VSSVFKERHVAGTAHRIDRSLLKHDPPRPLPPWLIADLLGDQLVERPWRSYLDPLLISGLCVALVLAVLRVPVLLSWSLALLLAVRLSMLAWEFLGPALADIRLLRYGLIVRAHVLRMRPNDLPNGETQGAYLDCVMPISKRRSSVGSVWLSDLEEAARLAGQGRVQVICLPRSPGTWRLLEGKSAESRYETLPQPPEGQAPFGPSAEHKP
jgi:hypothetical protein